MKDAPTLIARGITILSVHRKGREVSFFGIPLEIWERLPGVVTNDLGNGTRVKTLLRGKRRVVFFSNRGPSK